MQISDQLEWPTMSKMIVLAWSDCDDAIPPWSHLEGTTFWQSIRVECACCDCFFPCCMNVSRVEQWSQKMSLGGLTERIGTTQKRSLAASRNESERRAIWTCQIGGSCFLRNRAKFYWTRLHRDAPLFVQNRHNSLHRYVCFMYINCLCTSRALFY